MISADVLSASCLSFFAIIDTYIAAAIQAAGCPQCHGALHAAHYLRKPRGHSESLEPSTTLRLSWCCGRDGCRHRVTPPSIRFWGRKVFTGPTILALQSTVPHSTQESQLREATGCSRQSIQRWRELFSSLWETGVGRTIAGWITLGCDERRQPQSVLSQWTGPWAYLATRWQLLIHPLTGGRRWETMGSMRGPLDAQKMDFAHLMDALQDPSRMP